MIESLLRTDADYFYAFLRIVAGIVIGAYGMQKLFGWFDESDEPATVMRDWTFAHAWLRQRMTTQ